jgi:ABC-type transporter Mla subunit MlaD
MPMSSGRNAVVAGAFVVGSLALGVWGSFMLADRSGFGSTREYVVRFSLADGASGLKRGSTVTLGGQPVGRVLAVDFARDEGGVGSGGGEGGIVARAVDVRVEVRSDLVLFESAPVYLEKPLLGTLSTLNFTGPGDPALVKTPQGASALLEAGEMLEGKVGAPGFLAQAGFGPEQVEQAQRTLAGVERAVTRVAEVVDRAGPEVEAGVAQARGLVDDVRGAFGRWAPSADTTMANVERASERLAPMVESAEKAVQEARVVLADSRAVVTENRARIDAIIANVESASAKVDRETIELINGSMRDARGAVAAFADALGEVERTISEQTPGVRRVLANLRLMSEQLKLTSVEVRSQPWRLIYQPTRKEVETQLLYDATRSFAEAASDLRAGAEAMQALAARGGASAPGAPDLEEVSRAIRDSLMRYQAAEEAFLERLMEREREGERRGPSRAAPQRPAAATPSRDED